MTEASPTLETLLRHQDWVRKLAHSLVADPARADDVAQQTLLEAITRAPQQLREPKAWLAKVARNAARMLTRQEQRRTRREQVVAAAAADTTAPDPAAVAQRAAAHKRVVDTLFAVPEPYHTVLLLRYFDDLEAQQIARRLGRPLATVRTQLQRGLERMRQQLDGEFGGDRAAWCASLLPLWGGKQAAVGVPILTTIGALLMTKWMMLVAAAIAATLLLNANLAPEAPPNTSSSGGAVVAATAADAAVTPTSPDEPQREVATAGAPDTPVAPVAAALRGRVVSPDGIALAGVTLAHQAPGAPRLDGRTLVTGSTSVDLDQPGLRDLLQQPGGPEMFAAGYGPAAGDILALLRGEPPARPRAVTDAAGVFAFEAEFDVDEVVVELADQMLYGAGRRATGAGASSDGDELLLIVGPAVTVSGRVQDLHGQPLAGAHVSLGYQIDALPGFAAGLRDTTGYRSWNAQSGDDGRFALGQVPAHPALQVTVQKRGFRSESFVTGELRGPIDCTLRTAAPQQRPRLAGVVRLADGRPAAGARVDFGQDGAVCGDDGSFAFDVTALRTDAPLTAWLPGLQPGFVTGLGERLRDDEHAGEQLELRLGEAALRITGRLLDAAGAPLANAPVVAVGSTFVGSSNQLLESLIGGQGRVRSDSSGRFELGGLSARDYVVRAIDPRTLLVLESAAIAAGTVDVELREPAGAFAERVQGVVVDRFGQPVAGAAVWLNATLLRGPTMSQSQPRNDGVVTDADGRFAIERCPRRGVQVVVGGDGLCTTRTDVPLDDGPLRFEVTRRLRFRLRALGGVPATAFEVRDETGAVLFTTELRPDIESTHRRVPIRGEPPTYVVDDLASHIVFFDGKREVLAQPLVLRAGDVVEIAY
ncbi:MAG: sigma-70 family RNA polymerase sigma factor [Planctomycetota bacterium]